MQSNVCVEAKDPQQECRANAEKSRNRLVSEAGKHQIEPNHIRLMPSRSPEQCKRCSHRVELPATIDIEVRQFFGWLTHLIGEYCQADKIVFLQLPGEVETIFIESFSARRKCGN